MIQPVFFRDLGVMDYKTVWDMQEQLLKENLQLKATHRATEIATECDAPTQHHLLLVAHPPVYTLGKSGDMAHVLISEEERLQQNIAFFHTNRGGDITFHGPQQIVGYPILDLEKFYTDIGRYLRNLEEVIIQALAYYGLEGQRSKGETGVWLDADIAGKERKICAMGVRCSRWVTMHGFAFNINTDLSYFNYIVPCGIINKKVTSLEQELGKKVDFDEAKQVVKNAFEKVFEVKLVSYQ